MMIRRLITSLLIVVLSLSGATRTLAATRDEDSTVTVEEEREAQELVEQFNKKFVETNDISPLVKEYFVPDFASRLRQHAETFPLLLVEWKDESAPPDPDDLLRFYVASTNCLHLFLPLYAAALLKANEGRVKGADEKEPKIEDILPPAALDVIESDPLLREISKEMKDESAPESPENNVAAQRTDDSAKSDEQTGEEQTGEEQKSKIDDDELKHKIDDAKKLRRVTSALESLAKIMREHLAAHPFSFDKQVKQSGGDESEEKDDDRTFDPEKVEIFKHANVLDKEFYGYPQGTRLICAEAGLLHVELVRVDGKLRILTVYLLIDD